MKRAWMITSGIACAAAGVCALKRSKASSDLKGLAVLITGGSRGLGLGVARAFAAEGCRVAICARDEEELKRAKGDLQSRGADVFTTSCDIRDEAQARWAAAAVIDRFGQIDILVNNAGVIEVGPFENMALADFDEAMNTIFWGALHMTLAVLPAMRERGDGRIVNVTSIGGKISVPHLLPYSCAKFALVALSEGLRAELSCHGISVTAIVPGLMRTGSHIRAKFKGDRENEYRWFSLGASLPVVSMSAAHAADLIVKAARDRKAQSIFPWNAFLAAKIHALLPNATASLLSLVDRAFLPGAGAPGASKEGRDIRPCGESYLEKAAKILGTRASHEFNQISFDLTQEIHNI